MVEKNPRSVVASTVSMQKLDKSFHKSRESALCDASQALAPPLWDGLVTTKESLQQELFKINPARLLS